MGNAVKLADEIGCGIPLARDLLLLADNDIELVKHASETGRTIEGVKAIIIQTQLRHIKKELRDLRKKEGKKDD